MPFIPFLLLTMVIAQRGANIASNWNAPASVGVALAQVDYSRLHNVPTRQPIIIFNGCVHGTCESSRIIPAQRPVLLHNGCVHGNCESNRWSHPI